MKKAFITGISGQVGSYLAELLLEKGYEVHGLLRRSSSINTGRIDHIFNDLQLHYGDLTDAGSIARLIDKIKPEEVYNLGAQSHVRVSFDIPIYTSESVAIGALNVLEAIKGKGIKFYQASSSELYGGIYGAATNEMTPFHPRSPYAVAKHFAYSMTVNYREAYNEFACNGILFNTESPRRGETFVTKKIVKAAVRIQRGLQDKLFLGNLEAKRDWGYAKDYADGIYRILQHSAPDDYVLATGETHNIKEFLDEAFGYLNLDWTRHVVIDSKYFRPTEVDMLLGDASKAKRVLSWKPKVKFRELVKLMIDSELEAK